MCSGDATDNCAGMPSSRLAADISRVPSTHSSGSAGVLAGRASCIGNIETPSRPRNSMATPGPSQVRPTILERSSRRSTAPTSPTVLPEPSRTTRVSTAERPGRSHESARCNASGIALSAMA